VRNGARDICASGAWVPTWENRAVSDRIRQAASVIVVRDAERRPQVLVLERSAASRFLPSYVVFPGGAVDAEDAALAQRWFGSHEEAPRAAAVRELVEEAGLALTADGLIDTRQPAGGETDAMRAVEARPPYLSQLRALCHWIAPEDVPVRFDARYFAVRSPGGLDPTPDGDEAVRAWWIEPRQLLAEWEQGERKLYWPTWYTVNQLAACESTDAVLELSFETREPDDDLAERLPRSVFWQD
jgi:recombination protein RecT